CFQFPFIWSVFILEPPSTKLITPGEHSQKLRSPLAVLEVVYARTKPSSLVGAAKARPFRLRLRKAPGETDLYGTLAVKGHRCVNPGHSRAAGRSPAILGGRAGQLSAACPPTSTPQGSAAGCPARCGIFLLQIDQRGHRCRPPSWPGRDAFGR